MNLPIDAGDSRGMDDIEIRQKPMTVRTEHGHVTSVEMEVVVWPAGTVAVFAPDPDDVARGEADLVAEHLRRRAEAFREELRRLRRAFRSASRPDEPSLALRPFFSRVEVDGLQSSRPSIGRAVLVLAAGVAVGSAGGALAEEGSALHFATLAVSIVLMVYGALGGLLTERFDRSFDEGHGLPVGIRRAGEIAERDRTGTERFEGPYIAVAEVVVENAGGEPRAVPSVRVVDRAGGSVEVLRPGGDSAPLEMEAAVLLQRGRELATTLNRNEMDAWGITARGRDDGSPEDPTHG